MQVFRFFHRSCHNNDPKSGWHETLVSWSKNHDSFANIIPTFTCCTVTGRFSRRLASSGSLERCFSCRQSIFTRSYTPAISFFICKHQARINSARVFVRIELAKTKRGFSPFQVNSGVRAESEGFKDAGLTGDIRIVFEHLESTSWQQRRLSGYSIPNQKVATFESQLGLTIANNGLDPPFGFCRFNYCNKREWGGVKWNSNL